MKYNWEGIVLLITISPTFAQSAISTVILYWNGKLGPVTVSCSWTGLSISTCITVGLIQPFTESPYIGGSTVGLSRGSAPYLNTGVTVKLISSPTLVVFKNASISITASGISEL